MVANRGMNLSVHGISGYWSEPPKRFSFSSLETVESCPRRFGLTRASYPDLWSGTGYPSQPTIASLVGDVVHDSLEMIIAALAQSGCESTHDIEAVDTLRALGGYSAVIHSAIDAQLKRLQKNPRCRDRADRLRTELTLRLSDMRQTTQALLSRSKLAPSPPSVTIRSASRHNSSTPVGSRPLDDGSHPELDLTSSRLRLTGRADLVTIKENTVHIIDYKTGSPSDHHPDQLRLYALIWAHRDNFDVDRPLATHLTLSYPNHDIEVEPPSARDLEMLESETIARIAEATSQIEQIPPEARPSEENCKFCSVRHLCDPYWAAVSIRPPAEGFVDLRGEVLERNGPKSWSLQLDDGEQLTLRIPAEYSHSYDPGSWVRILGAVVTPATEAIPMVASVVATSEVYLETQPGAVVTTTN